MTTYKIKLSYKGTAYSGWQIQSTTDKTIQGQINKVLSIINKSEDVSSLGSGRTDAGVHAIAQVARLTMPLHIPPANLKEGMNSLLPEDIVIQHIEECEESFHPISASEWKEYIYLFQDSNFSKNPITSDYITHFRQNLDFQKMQEAAKLFIGEHDFCNFFTTGSEVHSTVRTILECELILHDAAPIFKSLGESVYCLRIRGTGFLKQMVRLIMGALFEIGRGKIEIQQLESALKEKLDQKIGPVAPANGLILNRVQYPS